MWDHSVSINGVGEEEEEESTSSTDEKRGVSRMTLGKGMVNASVVVVVSAVTANRIKTFWNIMVIQYSTDDKE
jgi:hypothetical protein